MGLIHFVCIVSAFLLLCEGDSYWTTPWTTAYPVGPGVDLRGKMVTLSQDSGVTFFHPYYSQSKPEDSSYSQSKPEDSTNAGAPVTTAWPTAPSTQWPTEWTTHYSPYTTTPYPSTGVSVCLRFMSDSNNFNLFKLSPRSPMTFTWSSSYCTLSWYYYNQVNLNPRISLWNSVHTQPWTSLCLTLDPRRQVAQLFQGGAMSIRKIVRDRMPPSWDPVVDMSGFDGQVTDLEIWDYPLKYREVLAYMQNYGSSGTFLSWSNMAYKYRGSILVEEAYNERRDRGSSGEQRGSNKPLKYKKIYNDKRQKNRQMF